MWKLYKYDGNYIMGELISKHKTQSAALKRAQKEIGHVREVEEQRAGESLIWLDGDTGTPLGVIVKSETRRKNFPE